MSTVCYFTNMSARKIKENQFKESFPSKHLIIFKKKLFELTLLSAGDVLLTPAKLYSPSLLPVLRSGHVKSFVFIAEEGLLEGISRILPEHVSAILGKYQIWLFLFDKFYIPTHCFIEREERKLLK